MGFLRNPREIIEEVRKEMTEEEKKEEKYTFKEKLIGLDLLASMEGDQKEALKTSVNLAARATDNPKLSNKDILMMDLKEFQNFMRAFQDKYDLKEGFLD